MNGSVTKCLQVSSGVPQGSILGPSLFVLLINDLSAGLSPGVNNMLYWYADDTKIWRKMVDEVGFNTKQRYKLPVRLGLHFYSTTIRLGSLHIDHLSLVSDMSPRGSSLLL